MEQENIEEELKIEKEEDDGYPLNEYQLTTTPNDFNILTIISFIESKVFKIPSFQRHYVWDLKRASKLIESLLIGLPIPQIFLYESDRNEFLVIDGQQRLMTIYYFVKGRFPRKEKRAELREIFDQCGYIPDEVMADDELFQKFNLRLDGIVEGSVNRFHGKNYQTLDDYKTSLDLSTIRNMVVKPVSSDEESGAMFEIFNRLNSGGINLGAQEIRMSLYHSDFLRALLEMNKDERWRRILGKANQDIRLNDVEAILRVFAMVTYAENYKATINGFINKFANHAKSFNDEKINYYKSVWSNFLDSCSELDISNFRISSNRFSIMLFESVFYASCKDAIDQNIDTTLLITSEFLELLKADEDFKKFTYGKTTLLASVKGRLAKAKELLGG
ncbi:hypothetical protein BPUTSESOX_2217 [uncultured Gammaproteobacteria bacterium]|jgi:hypothetical protein|nr:hypothetical protein [uncultured Gammaproteobacteria bacterium]CAC9660347.1 hypothetical protein [uncultured Gammaproteobacteria bacterium]VVH51716.1 hypothetical protein BPUTSESOX_2217 [uncultured Gammaproteobacteria bacterium]